LNLALNQLKLIFLLRPNLFQLSRPPVISVLPFKDKSLVIAIFLLQSTSHLGHYLISRLALLIINSLQLMLNFLILLLDNFHFILFVLKFNFQIIDPSAEYLQVVIKHRLCISLRVVPLPKLLDLPLELFAFLIMLGLNPSKLLLILGHDLLLSAMSLITQFFNNGLNFFVSFFHHIFADLPLHLYVLVLCLLQ
jgi:hypothetical protein